jgi:hypothetical protein
VLVRAAGRAHRRRQMCPLLRPAWGRPVTDAKPTIVGMSLRDLVGDQLALELHPDAPPGETETDLGDLNFDRLDAAEERLAAAIAALGRARPCRCERPLVLVDGTDDPVCSKCGRAPA